jgi:hypothetical protein
VTGAAFDPVKVFTAVEQWLLSVTNARPIFVSDNLAYDFQWFITAFTTPLVAIRSTTRWETSKPLHGC